MAAIRLPVLKALIAGALATALAWSPSLAQGTFQTPATHALLVDADSGSVLFEKAADEPFAPASMAKLMTVEILFRELTQNRINMDTEFPVSENAWRKGGGSGGGSSMFAQVNSRIKVSDLLRGIIVQSGNDASIVVAEGLAGTEENFARIMNERARELGLRNSVFRNSTGFSHPEQKVTARDLAKLAIHIIETYPELYKIYSEREFTWNKIRQQNRNPLLGEFPGADGLKTGFLDESGYALTGSAVQNGQRLVMVISGLKTIRDRATAARSLLDYGFRAFDAKQLFAANEPVGTISVYGGDRGDLPLVSPKPVRLLSPKGSNDPFTARIVYTGPLRAPVAKGAQVARLQITRGGAQALDIPLYAAEDVGHGSVTQRAVDGLMELGTGLFRRAYSSVVSGS